MTNSPKTPGSEGFLRGARPDRSLARRTLALLAGAFLLSLLALALVGENGLGAWWRLRSQEAKLRQEVADLEQRNADLEQRLQDLDEDPAYLERIAREEYNLQKPDEEVLLIVPAQSAGDARGE